MVMPSKSSLVYSSHERVHPQLSLTMSLMNACIGPKNNYYTVQPSWPQCPDGYIYNVDL